LQSVEPKVGREPAAVFAQAFQHRLGVRGSADLENVCFGHPDLDVVAFLEA